MLQRSTPFITSWPISCTFFLSAYLLFFLFMEATSASLFHLTIDQLPFLFILLLRVLASVSFSQFLSLFFTDPTIIVGVFVLMVAYFSFYFFDQSFLFGIIFPNMFFSFAYNLQTTNIKEAPTIHPDKHWKLTELSAVLLLQTLVYFLLSLLFDKFRRDTVFSKPTKQKPPSSLLEPPFISANLHHKNRDLSYEFEVREGSVSCLLGATESGKSEIINLLSGT